jgi:6-phosphogluconolactonase (cycloisomerase 2 family)
VHPGGKFVYVANRASGTTTIAGRHVFAGGENNIAVYALNERTGKPALVQHADSHGYVPRTFAIDPTGKLLVAANSEALAVASGAAVEEVTANLALFTIGDDGKLTHVATHDIDTAGAALFWMGLVALPARPHYMTAR